jgi:CRISPR-associated protein Csx10
MIALKYHLTTISPLLVTGVGGGDPNSEISAMHVPGSTLRGLFAGEYLKVPEHAAAGADAAKDAEFRRLFLNGAVCFLNAYPAALDDERMLPIPLSWRVDKDGDPDNIHDLAVARVGCGADTPPAITWQGVKQPFAHVLPYEEVDLAKPDLQISIHTARRDRQKVTSGGATVFRYDALAPGQRFVGAIVAESQADLETLVELIPDGARLRLGRSQGAGYGLIEITYVRAADNPQQFVQPFTETQTPASGQNGNIEVIIVTLLSDAILRDPQTGAYFDNLAPALGGAKPAAAWARTRTVAGFNRTWNLPLPQVTAIQAGSVFVYPYSAELADILQQLAATGVGERRAEGFGRLAVGWQTMAKLRRRPRTASLSSRTDVVLQGASAVLANQICQRILRNRLDAALLQAISTHRLERVQGNKAQLARLRLIVQRAQVERSVPSASSGKIDALLAYLDDSNLKKPARDQLLRSQVNGSPLLSWLLKLASSPAEIRGILGFENMAPIEIGGQRADLTTQMEIEYTLRLIDGVIHLAAKEANHG